MEFSKLFVVLMGMGTTFVGLTCIIFLTMLLGKIMQALDKRRPQAAPPAAPAIPAQPVAPGVPADGVPNDVKVAIIAALMQMPGFRMEDVTSIVIHKA